MSQPVKPFERGVVYLLGTAIPLLLYSAVLFVLVLVLDHALDLISVPHANFGGWFNLILGLSLVIISWRVIHHKNRVTPKTRSMVHHEVDSGAPRYDRIFLLGMTMLATSLSTIIFVIPAINIIGLSSVSVPAKVVVALLFDLLVLVPMIMPPVIYLRDPKLDTRLLTPFGEWVRSYMMTIIGTILGLVGLYLAVIGLFGILSH